VIWQLSESLFVSATFFGAARYCLSWVKRRRRAFIIYIIAYIAFMAACIPLSYLFVNVELYRYSTIVHLSISRSLLMCYHDHSNRWNSIMTVTKPVATESLYHLGIWLRVFLWGSDANHHWQWLTSLSPSSSSIPSQ
jgi:predicted membrane protein